MVCEEEEEEEEEDKSEAKSFLCLGLFTYASAATLRSASMYEERREGDTRVELPHLL
jgi:hypothetical protein